MAHLARPDAIGHIFLGIADVESDAKRVKKLYGTEPILLSDRYIVGVDHEAQSMKLDMEGYVRKLKAFLRNASSDSICGDLLQNMDCILYKGKSIMHFQIHPAREVLFNGNRSFVREGGETVEIIGQDIARLAQRLGRNS